MRKQTHGKIKDLISGLYKSTLMVLVNYIYFKGKDGPCFMGVGEGVSCAPCVHTLSTGKERLMALETGVPNF